MLPRLWKVTEGGFEELVTFAWTGSGVGAVAFSPDGRWLAAAGGVGRNTLSSMLKNAHGWVQLWAVEDDSEAEGGPLREAWTFTGPKARAWAIAFSPDSRTLAAGAEDGTIRLWDVEAGGVESWRRVTNGLLIAGAVLLLLGVAALWQLNRVAEARPAADPRLKRLFVLCCVPAVAGGLLLGVGLFLWWDGPAIDNGKVVNKERKERAPDVTALAFLPDGERLVSGNAEGDVWLWDVHGSPAVNLTLQSQAADDCQKRPVRTLCLSPDGKTLFSGHPSGQDGPLLVWSVGKKCELRTRLLEGGHSVAAIAISPDGKELVAATADHSGIKDTPGKSLGAFVGWRTRLSLDSFWSRPCLRCWEMGDAAPMEQTPHGGAAFVNAVWFAHGFQPLLSRNSPKTFLRWEPAGGRLQPLEPLADLAEKLPALSVAVGDPGGRFVVLIQQTVRSVRLRKEEKAVVVPEDKAAADKEDAWVFTSLTLYDRTGQTFTRQVCSLSWRVPVDATFSEDGKSLAWLLGGDEVNLWELGDEPRQMAVLKDFDGKATAVKLSPGADRLAVETTTGAVHLWRLVGVKAPDSRKTLKGFSDPNAPLDFHWGGKSLVAKDDKGKVKVWDLSGDEPRCVVEEKPVGELTAGEKKWVPDAPAWKYRLHALVEKDRVTVQREEPGGERKPVLEWSSPGKVYSARFSGDGRHLVVGNANGTGYVVRLDRSSSEDRLLAACDAVLARNPDDVAALLERARIHLRRGRLHLAREDAACAFRKDSTCAEARYLRGLVHVRRGDHGLAVQDFTAVLKLQPKNAAALHRRGVSRAARGDYAGAREDFAAALEIDPGIASARP